MANIKPSFNTNRMILGDQIPLSTPLSVVLDSSERCNFKCGYCFRAAEQDESWAYAGSNELMTMETFELAASQLSEFRSPIRSISLSGHGEPLANPNLAYMASRLREMNIASNIDIHTNASLLNQERAVALGRSGLTRIVVSLQGVDAESYKSTCGTNINFQKFYDNLKILYQNKRQDLKLHIKIADVAFGKKAYKENEKKFFEMFGEIADYVFVERVIPLWSQLSNDSNVSINKYGEDFGDIQYCSIVFYYLWVAPNGDIYPCPQIPPPLSLGNIRDTSLLDAWNSPRRIRFLEEHLRVSKCGMSACANCFVPKSTVKTKEDIIDSYAPEILARLGRVARHD